MIPKLDSSPASGDSNFSKLIAASAAPLGKGSYRIDHSPPDVLGIYIFPSPLPSS